MTLFQRDGGWPSRFLRHCWVNLHGFLSAGSRNAHRGRQETERTKQMWRHRHHIIYMFNYFTFSCSFSPAMRHSIILVLGLLALCCASVAAKRYRICFVKCLDECKNQTGKRSAICGGKNPEHQELHCQNKCKHYLQKANSNKVINKREFQDLAELEALEKAWRNYY